MTFFGWPLGIRSSISSANGPASMLIEWQQFNIIFGTTFWCRSGQGGNCFPPKSNWMQAASNSPPVAGPAWPTPNQLEGILFRGRRAKPWPTPTPSCNRQCIYSIRLYLWIANDDTAWMYFFHRFLSLSHSAACGTSLLVWCRSSLTSSIHPFLCLLVPDTNVDNTFPW